MPKVHEDQRAKFEEEFFCKFQRDTEIKYPLPKGLEKKEAAGERVAHLEKEMRDGTSCIAFKACGTNLPLRFMIPDGESLPSSEWADFDREPGKVHLKSRMVLNGVCCQVVAVLDLDTFTGVAHLEYDEDLAKREAKMTHDVVDIMPRPAPAFPPQSAGTPTMWDQTQLAGDTKPPHGF